MINQLIDQLILTAGQWKQFGGVEYERKFGKLLNELAWVAETTPEGALDLLLAELGEAGVAA